MDKYDLAKEGDHWKLRREGSPRALKVFDGPKLDAIRESAGIVRGLGGSLKIRKKNGAYQEERTYPRSADPRRTKG